MGKLSSELTVQNNRGQPILVILKESGDEQMISVGEAVLVFALGIGSRPPKFTVVASNDSIEVFTSDSDASSLFKLPTGSEKKHGTEPFGVFDRELDGTPRHSRPDCDVCEGDGPIPAVSTF